jgi:Short-chain dehydrogenases of various substrate specificities
MKTILIVGATSSIAQACVRKWCKMENELEFIFIARDEARIKKISHDLMIKYPKIKIRCIVFSVTHFEKIKNIIDNEFAKGRIDIALIAQGLMYEDETNIDYSKIINILNLNCVSVAICVDNIYKNMLIQNSGKIGVFSSVAADRGRKNNYLYGASKAFVSTYVEGLQHKINLLNQKVNICLIKPGPTSSNMTRHLVEKGKKLANIDKVATVIVDGIEENKLVVYSPKIWSVIMCFIRRIPFFIFRKLDI